MMQVIVKALKVNVGTVGEKTQLSVRPERVSLGLDGNEENSFHW